MTNTLHILQHAAFESEGIIADWAENQGLSVTRTRFHRGEPLPERFDAAIIMGGPMGVGDDTLFPWLTSEKQWLTSAIQAGNPLFGVCLGAQLLAHALGAEVKPHIHKEIGFFPVRFQDSGLPEQLTVFHWHGDRFAMPQGAVPIASSEGCDHQGFFHEEKIIGLQFHAEVTEPMIRGFLRAGKDELQDPSPWVQNASTIRAGMHYIPEMHALLITLLNRWKASW